MEQGSEDCDSAALDVDGTDDVACSQTCGLRNAIDNHAIVDICDAEGRITLVNERFCKVSGYSEAELLGHTHAILNSGLYPSSFFDEMRRTLAGGTVWTGTLRNRAKDGSFFWLDTTITPQRNENGDITHYISVRTDVTSLLQREGANREQNHRFNQAMANMSQGLSMFDADHRLIFSNERYATIYGIDPGDIAPGMAFADILKLRIKHDVFASESPEQYMAEWLDSVRLSADYSTVQQLNDGRFIAISHRPLDDGGWVSTHEDITDLKKTEASLRESQELFSKVFQANPAACAIAAPEDGFHYDVNKQWMELMGYTREEALEHTALSLGVWADPADRARFVSLLETHGAYKGYETKFRRKNGDIIDVRVSGTFADFHGQPRLFNIYEDITERKQAQRQLARQTSVMSLMKSVAFTANQSTNADHALRSCLELIGMFMGWEVGRVYDVNHSDTGAQNSTDCWFLSDSEAYGSFKEASLHAAGTPEGNALADRIISSGEPVWTQELFSLFTAERAEAADRAGLAGGIAVPIKIIDATVAVLEFFSTEAIDAADAQIDVLTEVGTQIGRVMERARNEAHLIAHRDRLEELVDQRTDVVKRQAHKLKEALTKEKELNALQRQFVSMASHEFRTPLSIIDGSAYQLAKKADDISGDYLAARTTKIRDAVSRMTQLMQSTLTAARMQDGKIEIHIGACNIKKIITEVCTRQRDLSREHDIRCTFADVPATIQADGSALDQVITNLLSNAVKYSPGSPRIDVVAQGKGNEVIIAVRDQGLGIDEDDMPKMFERFFRAKTSTGIAGTGIGLNLVKMLVEMHEGSINVKSEPGKGSLFIVRLPVAGPTQAAEPQAAAG